MSVCTSADIKDRLGIPTDNTENDTTIATIVSAMAALFDTYTNRSLIVTAQAVTEHFCSNNGSQWLQLPRYPVVSITTIKEAIDYDFANVAALIANSDYRLSRSGIDGLLYRLYAAWPSVPDSVQVVYRGGYTAAGGTPGTGEIALPADLREAAILQGTFTFKRRMDIGLSGQSFDGGSINKFSEMNLLPQVREILDLYKRIVL